MPQHPALRPEDSGGSGVPPAPAAAREGSDAAQPSRTPLPVEEVLLALASGDLQVQGRLVDASNVALVGSIDWAGASLECVYKPTAGERPLWDFPDETLGKREVATYRLAAALGWPLVPPTAWREDGPAGAGMCQLWVDTEDESPYVDVVRRGAVPDGWRSVVDASDGGGRPVTLVHADSPDLRRVALLDAVANNADRKGGHLLTGPHGRPQGIDHGLTFHDEEKLRTVLWGWAGERLDDAELDDLATLRDRWDDVGIDVLISARERRAARRRLDRLLDLGEFPYPGRGWPALPWPPF